MKVSVVKNGETLAQDSNVNYCGEQYDDAVAPILIKVNETEGRGFAKDNSHIVMEKLEKLKSCIMDEYEKYLNIVGFVKYDDDMFWIVREYLTNEINGINVDRTESFYHVDESGSISESATLGVKNHIVESLYESDAGFKFTMDELEYLDKILFEKIERWFYAVYDNLRYAFNNTYHAIKSNEAYRGISKDKFYSDSKMFRAITKKTCESVVKYMEFGIDLKPIFDHIDLYFNIANSVADGIYRFREAESV